MRSFHIEVFVKILLHRKPLSATANLAAPGANSQIFLQVVEPGQEEHDEIPWSKKSSSPTQGSAYLIIGGFGRDLRKGTESV